jgi:hypothetical protein
VPLVLDITNLIENIIFNSCREVIMSDKPPSTGAPSYRVNRQKIMLKLKAPTYDEDNGFGCRSQRKDERFRLANRLLKESIQVP